MDRIYGIGIDIVEVARIERSLLRHEERFRDRVFGPTEIAYCESLSARARLQSYAARFAAKEAIGKALGVGVGPKFDWREIEVGREESGAPKLLANGRALNFLAQIAFTKVLLSLSHTEHYAAAQAVALVSDSP